MSKNIVRCVLHVDVKGTSFAMKNEPQRLREHLSTFYAICRELAVNVRTLGEFQSFTFSDTFLMNILTPPSDTIARAIREFAEDLIDRCARNNLRVRAFMTTGVESAEELPPALVAGADPNDSRYQHLFGVHTGVIAADVGEHAHLDGTLYRDGTLFADERIWALLDRPAVESYVTDGSTTARRSASGSSTASMPAGPAWEFYRLR